ncbi:MAG TPA: hypothetical protein VFA68_21525 [Terriglobales bacterium]|nr:hypothetical protein [Terriglobales bacterium]
MGWVQNEFQNRRDDSHERHESAAEVQFESRERRVWSELVRGLENDLKEFSKVGGDAVVERVSDTECRVSNPKSGIAVTLNADLEGRAIRYHYEPESDNTAVPEGGVITMRSSEHEVALYSADQRLSNEEARRLMLEPLLFPRAPLQGLEPTGT